MNRIQLFIENKEIELNDSVRFAITKTFEDISNPSTIFNDWSKTVEIPFSNRNNQIFGHIYCPDKVVVEEVTADKVGVYFNPYLKLDMRLLFNNILIISGYAKMTEVSRTNGVGSYKVNLNGSLGKVFQEMKKITFDTNAYTGSDRDKYYIDGAEYVEEKINKSIVARSWNSAGQIEQTLQKKWRYVILPDGTISRVANLNYHLTDIIGFAPCNAKDGNFDYTMYQLNQSSSEEFSKTLEEQYESLGMNVNGGDLVKEGLLPRDIGEFRSYNQMPYIYFNKLFKIFQEKAETLTGYNFNLDTDWFTTDNPYWYKLVFMLSKLKTDDGNSEENVYDNINGSPSNILADWIINQDYTTVKSSTIYPRTITYEPVTMYNNQKFYLNNKFTVFKNNLNLRLVEQESGGSGQHIKADNGLFIRLRMVGSNGVEKMQDFVVLDKASTLKDTYKNNVYQIIEVDNFTAGSPNFINIKIDNIFTKNKDEDFGEYVQFYVQSNWIKNEYPIGGSSARVEIHLDMVSSSSQMLADVYDDYYRSNGNFVLNDLWNKDYNIFDEIIKYCKTYRILVYVDDNNRTINFTPYYKYFTNYEIEDWTDKVDMGKDFILKPITFEDKYVLFNYEDSDTAINKAYVDKFGMQYGEKKIITEYNFNTETKNLFEGIKQPLVSTDNVFSWANIYYGRIRYTFPAEIYVNSKSNDNTFVDNFGTMYFHCGLSAWDTEAILNLRDVYISDDTDYQIQVQKYFYTQVPELMTKVTTYPHLDIVLGKNLCTFGVPSECYTYLNNYSGKMPIYDNFWKNYIEERYNIQNKIVTCYIKLSPLDYNRFKFNRFVKIQNQLYFVNKIYDYDMTSLEPTKVDLITIQDIKGYNINNFSI